MRRVFIVLSLILVTAFTGCGGDDGAGDLNPQQPRIIPPKSSSDIEVAFGGDPNKSDTDDDGLTDIFEITQGFPVLRPNNTDTNGNGIPDANEDSDGDGLTNLQEQTAETRPLKADTDGDGLSDGEEINTYRTNPLIADTDRDGMVDGREVANGSNPLVADANTTITSVSHTEVMDSTTGAVEHITVKITGVGDQALGSTVRPGSDFSLPGQVGRRYEISRDVNQVAPFQSATVTLPIDLSHPNAADPSKLAIFTISPTTGFWSELPTTLDTAAQTATATTTHFSPFVVASKDTLESSTNTIPKTCDASVQVDAALVIDSSGSMQDNDPLNLRKTAAQNFVASMKATDRAAVIDFDDFAILRQGLTNNVSALNNAIAQIDSFGGTDIGAGVSTGLLALGSAQQDRSRVVVLLTDGNGNYAESLTTQMVDGTIRAFTIGLTGSVNEPLLRDIANRTGGIYQQISSADLLQNIFAQYATVFKDDGKDTDEDGLTDCQEIQGVYLTNLGRIVRTKPDKKDSDGDGIDDGVEVGIPQKVDSLSNKPFSAAGHSDPNSTDTDGDGVSDPEEYQLGSNPFARDSDGDGLTDGDEVNRGTIPLVEDSDGDNLLDGYEVRNSAKGLDPLVYDYTTIEYIGEFLQGLFFGDILDTDTVPQLAGQISSGFAVIGDVRDFLANLAKGEWASAALNAVGVVPLAGDGIKASADVVTFFNKFPLKRYELITYVDKHIPGGIAKLLPPIPAKVGPWLLKPLDRGKAIEKLEKVLNKCDGTKFLGNYPTLDCFDFATGVATSIKSLDLDAKSYQTASGFRGVLRRYAKPFEVFTGVPSRRAGDIMVPRINPGDIKARVILVPVPRAVSAEFKAIAEDVAKNAKVEITFDFIPVP